MRLHFSLSRYAAAGVLAVVGAAAAPAAQAQYLVTTGTKTALFSGNSADAVNPTATSGSTYHNNTTLRTLPFNFTFYGITRTSISVSTNGNINFTSLSTGNNVGFPNAKMIAPLWDELYVRQGANDTITEVAGTNYEAIDWHVETVNDFAGNQNFEDFQAVLFGGNATFGGFNFQANDIAFSYNTLYSQSFVNNDVTIGLDSGNSTQGFTLLANAPPRNGLYVGGEATSSTTSVPFYGTSNQFVLFRPTGANTYSESIVSTASSPEPGAAVLLLGGMSLAPVVRGLARRRR